MKLREKSDTRMIGRIRALSLFISILVLIVSFAGNQIAMADANETTTNSSYELAQSTISLGDTHTCVVVQYEGIRCWGSNPYGELGNNSLSTSQVPVNVASVGKVFKTISLGSGFACALSSEREVFCWGRNTNGQIGDGTTANRRTPVGPIVFPTTVEQISAGLGSVCALLSNSTIRCWGQNSYGQLGDNSTIGKLAPSTTVGGLIATPTSVSVGHSHACALLINGQVQCWGRNNWGQLGTGTSGIDSLQAASVVNLSENAVAISSGLFHSCVILQSGGVQCWGQNSGGKLGNNSNLHSSSPVSVQSLSSSVRSLSLGESQSCALTVTNAAFCWGGNNFGEIGDSSTTQRWVATQVSGMGSGVMALSAGDSHSCAVLISGDVKCWGSDSSGQLGNGIEGSRTSPGTAVSLGGRVGVTTTIPSSSSSTTSSTVKTNSPGGNQSTEKSTNGNSEGSAPQSSANSSGSGTEQRDGSGDVQSSDGYGTNTNSQTDNLNEFDQSRVRSGTIDTNGDRKKSRLERKLRLENNVESFSVIILMFAIIFVAFGSRNKKKGDDSSLKEYFWLFGLPKNGKTRPKPEQDYQNKGPSNDFKTPRAMTAEDGALYGRGPKFMGGLFVYEIFAIQTLSKFRILRIGLRRWAELSLLSPVIAALIPLIIFCTSTSLAIMVSNDWLSEVVAVSVLFLFSVLMPVFSIIAICGWFLGRLSSGMSVAEQAVEAVLLLIGLGFTPLAMRVLIGPTWKSLRRGLIFPAGVALMVAYLGFDTFIKNLSSQIGTYANRLSGDSQTNTETFSTRIVEYLTFEGENTHLFVATALVLTSLVAFSAVWLSDYQGRPIMFLNSLHDRESSKYLLRREYAENVRVELKEGSSLTQALQYVFAGCVMGFLMWDVTFGWTVPIVVGFLLGYFVIAQTKIQTRTRTIHPASRAAILFVVITGVSNIMKNYAIVGTVVIGGTCLVFLLLRPRQLWSQEVST